MTEEEEREALAVLRDMEAMLDEIAGDLRLVQRSMTMIELRIGMLTAALEARRTRRSGLPDDPPDA